MSNSLTLGTSITPASSTSTSSTSPPFTLLCLAPTGTGKSTIAYEFLSRVTNIMRYQEMDGVAVYTAPLKSIVSEKYRELKGIFEEGQVAMVTGDGSVNLTPSTSLVVCTTECLRNALYKSGRIGGKDVKGVCIDEFQYLGEGGRGGAIEEVMILSPPSVPMCFLTATMSNHESVSRWMSHVRSDSPVSKVEEKDRAVGLRWEWWDGKEGRNVFRDIDAGPGGRNEFRDIRGKDGKDGKGGKGGGFGDNEGRKFRGKSLSQELAAAARKPKRKYQHTDLGKVVDYLDKGDKTPGIVFVFSRRGCEDGAKEVGGWLEGKENRRLLDAEQVRKVKEIIKNEVSSSGLRLTSSQHSLLCMGVHYHHAGLLPPHRLVVEKLFNARLLPVLFATTTLAAGVNLPCKTAVVMGMRKRGDEGWGEITKTEIRQIAGRAGRRGIDTVGHCMIIPGRRDKLTSIKFLLEGETEGVESCFSVRYGLVMAGVGRKGGMRKLVERNFGTWSRRERGGEEGGGKGMEKVREVQAAKSIRDKVLRDRDVEGWVKEVMVGDGRRIGREIKSYMGMKRNFEEGMKTISYLSEQGEQGDGEEGTKMEEWTRKRGEELNSCFISQVAQSVNDMKKKDELFRLDMNRLLGEGEVSGDVIMRIYNVEVQGMREMEKASRKKAGNTGKAEGPEVWDEYKALIKVLERYGCIEDAGVGVDEDGIVIYRETEEGEEVRKISADNPLHIAACLGEVHDGKRGGKRGEELRDELGEVIDGMTAAEFAGYVSCLAEENGEGALYETGSEIINEALVIAAEVSNGVHNAQVEEGVNVEENGCYLDSSNADFVLEWAEGEVGWEEVVEGSGRMEGDVARVLMRTADVLKQLENKGRALAGAARGKIIRGELEEFYYGK